MQSPKSFAECLNKWRHGAGASEANFSMKFFRRGSFCFLLSIFIGTPAADECHAQNRNERASRACFGCERFSKEKHNCYFGSVLHAATRHVSSKFSVASLCIEFFTPARQQLAVKRIGTAQVLEECSPAG